MVAKAGKQGEAGAAGQQGQTGKKGQDGQPGEPGEDGQDGTPGQKGIDGGAGGDYGQDGEATAMETLVLVERRLQVMVDITLRNPKIEFLVLQKMLDHKVEHQEHRQHLSITSQL